LTSLQQLHINGNNLTGNIPQSIVDLRDLVDVHLRNNSLTGTIPENIGKNQPNLYILDFSENNLTGGLLPLESLTNCSGFLYLWLYTNDLSGEIPPFFGNISSLLFLNLAGNNFHGSIPPQLGSLTSLMYLAMDRNYLTGRIPPDLSKLSDLTLLNFASNNLGGEILIDFSNFSSLANLSFYNNNLEGPFPSSIYNCSTLNLLDLGTNKLSGPLPFVFTGGSDFKAPLRYLDLRSNNFSGEVPSWIWRLQNLQVLDLSGNTFIGELPTDLSHLSAFISSFKISNPDDSQTSLTWLQDQEVQLVIKGQAEVYKSILAGATLLDLSNNSFTGPIPTGLSELVTLKYLNLSGNDFSGSLNGNIANLSQLEELDLSRNNISGGIPESLTTLGFLGVLDLSFNNFSGPIPAENSFNTKYGNISFYGNPGLCGNPLTQQCPKSNSSTGPASEVRDSTDFPLSTDGIITGFWVGFALVIGSILSWKSSRDFIISPQKEPVRGSGRGEVEHKLGIPFYENKLAYSTDSVKIHYPESPDQAVE
jgi:Leucine-rich repeat (LRR) protein